MKQVISYSILMMSLSLIALSQSWAQENPVMPIHPVAPLQPVTKYEPIQVSLVVISVEAAQFATGDFYVLKGLRQTLTSRDLNHHIRVFILNGNELEKSDCLALAQRSEKEGHALNIMGFLDPETRSIDGQKPISCSLAAMNPL